jgi:putative tryptophan/tyrosine transport system substrate-binding protein
MFNPKTAPDEGAFFLDPLEPIARSLEVEPIVARVTDANEIESAVAALARKPGGSLIIMPDAFNTVHRQLIILLAARHSLPAIYPYRYQAVEGGLLSYGVDTVDLMRRAAPYVDRILKGEKPADLPVQAPVKFELVVNLRAARVIGLTVPPAVIARADEVIE